MAPRFTLTTLWAAMSFVAVWMGLLVAWIRLVANGSPVDVRVICDVLHELSPAWAPIVFLAYAIGRRHLSWGVILSFAIVEAGLIGSIKWVF